MNASKPPFRRLSAERWVAGVCGGTARYFGWDPSLVRILWLIGTLIPVLPGLPAYIVLWLVMDSDPTEPRT